MNARRFKRSNIVRDPARKHIFTDLTGSKGEHNRSSCFLWRIKIEPVEIKKHDHRCQRGSFISVNERVITRNTEAIGSRERGIKLSPYDPKHAEAMEFARRSFRKYADTYKALAK